MTKEPNQGLKGVVVPIGKLTSADIERMYQLMNKYYENTAVDQFRADLFKKNAVILLLEKKDRSIQGFSTLMNLQIKTGDRTIYGVFSGDTIIEKRYWGQRVLGQTFLRYMLVHKLKHFLRPVYWLLISKGYKTYLLMANNCPIHFPRYEEKTPAGYQKILDAFYQILYPQHFNTERGVILSNGPTCRLRSGVAEIDKNLVESNPRIRFFQDVNPNWHEGAELACISKMVLWTPFYYAIKSFLKLRLAQTIFRQAPRPIPDQAGRKA